MIITFFRSSGLSQYLDMCEMQYFITYVLGQPSPSNMKADMGSAGHLALEWLAILKMQYDEGKEILSLKTSAIDIKCDREDLYIPTRLSDEDVNKINKTRINKQIYLPTAKLDYGQIRYGAVIVNKLIVAAYDYFSKVVSPHHPWTRASFLQCYNCVWMALEQNNRHYDPRFRKIISPEQKFDLKIEEDWAKYSYFYQGKQIDGYLGLKGTIDLITEVNEDTIEVVDWKFGKMFNWGKNVPKTYESLQKDKQLMFYYYAIRKILPQYKNIVLTINFIRDGGAQPIPFDDSILEETENMIRDTFLDIKNKEMPKRLDPTYQDHRCKLFCPFYKRKVDGTNYCKHITEKIEDFGIDYVTETETREGHYVGYYENPGE
jgi:hypothetical protein